MIKYIFFLIIPLLIIIPGAYAETGKNFDTIKNEGGTISWSSHFERILDTNWNYQDYIFTDHPDYLQTETAVASPRLDKVNCEYSFYPSGLISGSPILIDDIIPFQSVDGSGIWNEITGLDDSVCSASWDDSKLSAMKSNGIGTLEYNYIFSGNAWKTELKATNLSGLNDRLFGFEQVVDLNSDTIFFGGSLRNLDNLDGMVFDRTFLENNEAKVIDLLNGQKFDFDLGFDNLSEVRVEDTGIESSRLTFQYFHNQNILPNGATLIIDPTFTSTAGGVDERRYQDGVDDDDCSLAGDYTNFTSTHDFDAVLYASVNANECEFSTVEFDISSLPLIITVTNVQLEYDINTVTNPRNCDFIVMSERPTTATRTQDIIDEIIADVDYVDNDAGCTTTGNNKNIVLGTTGGLAATNIESSLVAGWWALGFKPNLFNPAVDADGSHHIMTGGPTPNPTLIIEYVPTSPVTDLTATDIGGQHVSLDWSTPTLPTGWTVEGWQINFTTPQNENVATVAKNDTENTGTAYTVNFLTGETDYSFRVDFWTNGTCSGGCNAGALSNILNVTTAFDETVGFTPGSFNFTDSGTDLRDIRFEEIRINNNDIRLNVTYPNTFTNFKCDVDYQFLQANRTYSNLDSIALSDPAGYNETSFRFDNVTNVGEVITTYCWNDQVGNGTYVIVNTSIPFIDQINLFRSGEFGTEGNFGAIDLVTLLVFGVIATMGFNSKNEAVGAVFLIALTFGMAYFQLITIPTLFGGVFAAIIMVVLMQVRKD